MESWEDSGKILEMSKILTRFERFGWDSKYSIDIRNFVDSEIQEKFQDFDDFMISDSKDFGKIPKISEKFQINDTRFQT